MQRMGGVPMTSNVHPLFRRAVVLFMGLALISTLGCGRARPPVNPETPGLYALSQSMDLKVVLKPARQNTITVDWRLEDGSARLNEDYTAAQTSGTLTFGPGEQEKTIRVQIVDDGLYEGRPGEEFHLVLANAQGADIVQGDGVILIEDEDPMPFASITADTESIPATPYGDYRLLDGAGNELTLPLHFTFAPGETEKTFTVEVIDDGAAENDEVILLGVTDDLSGAMRHATEQIEEVTIQDDDRPDYAAVTAAPRRRLNDTGAIRFAYRIQWDDGSVADDHTWEDPYQTVDDLPPTSRARRRCPCRQRRRERHRLPLHQAGARWPAVAGSERRLRHHPVALRARRDHRPDLGSEGAAAGRRPVGQAVARGVHAVLLVRRGCRRQRRRPRQRGAARLRRRHLRRVHLRRPG